jgi:hypothetical protein
LATRIPARLSASEGRRFAFTVGAAFLVLAAVAAWRGRTTVPVVLASTGVVLLLCGVAIPSRLGPLYRAWMGLALAISKVTTPIFMGVVYFVVLTPTAFLKRAFGARFAPDRRASSFWVTRPEGAARRGDLERQF